MTKILHAVFIALFVLLLPAVNLAGTQTLTLEIEEMGWGDAETRVSLILDQYQSITDYSTDTGAETATITFDDQKLDLEALRDELSKAGFQVDGL